MVKWLTIGFLGTLGIFAFTFLILLWKFTPLISVDEENERVTILGGLIDVDGKAGRLQIGADRFDGFGFETRTFDGNRTIDRANIRQIIVPFTHGKLEFSPSHSENELRWKCRVTGGNGTAIADESKKQFTLSLEKVGGSKCDIQLPKGVPSVISGSNGKLEIERPHSDMQVRLDNGKVTIAPEPNRKYRFDLSVANGIVDDFVSSEAADALKIKVVVANGYIKRN